MELWTAPDAPGSFHNPFLNSYHNSDYKWFSNFVNLNSDSDHILQFFKSFSFKLPESEEEVPPIMIRIDRIWIQYKWVKYEKNIFPLQLSRRNGNSGGMLLPHLPQVQFVDEAFLRNTWKGCLPKIVTYFFFENNLCENPKGLASHCKAETIGWQVFLSAN